MGQGRRQLGKGAAAGSRQSREQRRRGGGRRPEGGTAESTQGAVAPNFMVVVAAPPGLEWLPGNPRGSSIPMAFLGLMDSTQLAGLYPASQGVDCPTNGENWERQLDDMANGKMRGRGGIPHQRRGKRAWDGQGRGGMCRWTPHN